MFKLYVLRKGQGLKFTFAYVKSLRLWKENWIGNLGQLI